MAPEGDWLRLRELFAAAVLLAPAARARYLDRECADDAELRRDVESLLRHDPGPEAGANGDADETAFDPDAPVRYRPAVESAPVAVGDRVGNIRIVEVLGAGGMGEVYVGFDETLQRKVALKAIGGRHRLRPEARARFLREARILSQLEHPNICRIHDYLTHGDSELLVLELIDGPTLSRAAADGLSFHRKLEIAGKIAEVLAAAHSEGIIHRDLKPDNVMLTRSGEVKVLDFGLARAVEPTNGESDAAPPDVRAMVSGPRVDLDGNTIAFAGSSEPVDSQAATAQLHASPPANGEDLTPSSPGGTPAGSAEGDLASPFSMALRTEAGSVVGTPLYMSPEQARGEVVTTASDMYSFGLLLQALFTGESPYPGGLDGRQILERARRGETRPVAGVDRDVAALVGQLKSVAPAARPTAATALERLRWIRDKPRRRLRRLIAAAVTAAVLLAGLKYTFDLRRERAIAVAARDEAELRRGQAEDLIGFMLGDLREKLAPVGRLEILDDVGDQAMEYFASLPDGSLSDDELARRSKALRQIGDVRMAQGDLEAAMEAFQESLALARGLAERDPDNDQWQVALGAAYFWVGYVRLEQDELDRALAQFRRYADISRRLVEKDPDNPDWQLEMAYGHSNQAKVLLLKGDVAGALEHYEASMRVRRRLVELAPEDPLRQRDLANSLSTLGTALEADGSWRQALARHLEALEIRRRLMRSLPEHTGRQRDVAISLQKAGTLRHAMGDPERAAADLEAALGLLRDLAEQDPENTQWSRTLANTEEHFGLILLARGDAGRALAHFRAGESILNALTAAKLRGGRWQEDLAGLRTRAGSALLARGAPAQALARAAAALAGLEEVAASSSPTPSLQRRLADAWILRGVALRDLGRAREAEAALGRALSVVEPLARQSRDLRLIDSWVTALLHLDRLEEARPILARLGALGYREPRLLSLCRVKGLADEIDALESAAPIDPKNTESQPLPAPEGAATHGRTFADSPPTLQGAQR